MITRKILIVEDEPSVAIAFQHVLGKSLEYNYLVEIMTSGEEALEAAKKSGPYDVILLDYFLPGMNGADFLKAFRTVDQQTVIIVISGGQDYKIVHDVFKLGADEFFSKEELSNPYVLEKAILAGLEKREYQTEITRREIARQRMDAITTVVRTVHHELNNPLAIMTLASSKLISTPNIPEGKVRQHLLEIREAVDRMSEILKRLPHIREESYNEELRGLKLYAIPNQPKTPKEDQ